MIAVAALWKALICGCLRQRAVLHVVHRHADDVARLRQRRPDAHAGQRHARRAGDRVLQLAAIAREMLDQAAHQVAGRGVRNVAHDGRDIDDVVALHHAEFEVVEKCQLHGSLPHSVRIEASTGRTGLSWRGCPAVRAQPLRRRILALAPRWCIVHVDGGNNDRDSGMTGSRQHRAKSRLRGFCVASILILSGTAVCAAAGLSLDVTPGLWELSTSGSISGTPQIPPELLAGMKPEQRAHRPGYGVGDHCAGERAAPDAVLCHAATGAAGAGSEQDRRRGLPGESFDRVLPPGWICRWHAADK